MSRQAEKERAERAETGSHERVSPYVVMASCGISPKKALGQNFLSDLTVVKKIVSAAGVEKSDIVLEIGPGLGIMTGILADRAGYVAAVEIDRDLAPALDSVMSGRDNIEIIYGDIMKVNVGELTERLRREHPGLTRVKVVANLPYYITSPIIMMLLEQYSETFSSLTFMVQKEVAERLVSRPGEPEYGAITLAVAYRADAEICFTVPSSCFVPRPKVDSAVVNLNIYKIRPVEPSDPAHMFRLIRASFAQRRKMLVNALSNAAYLSVGKSEVAGALESIGLNPAARGEELSVAQFAALSGILNKQPPGN